MESASKIKLMNKKELWLKLKAYHFNHIVPPDMWSYINSLFSGKDASTKAFADKISRKHGWKNSFTLEAIHEYKKFVYLGVISTFPVTPSKIIDVVWHEHLLFTKAYRAFCTEVIENDFEHNPELIAQDEQTEKFAMQYIQTLQLYLKEFGIDAPDNIWSLPKFNEKQLQTIMEFYRKKELKENEPSSIIIGNDGTLVSFFEGESLTEFGGGDFGGSGAGGDFTDGDSGDSGSSCSSGCGGGD